MIKSEAQIEQDVYDLLQPYLEGEKLIHGKVYKDGCRPGDSVAEDAVIAVSNASADQIQTGHVMVNIYVPDIDNGSGFPVPDKARLAELSALHEYLCCQLNDSTTDEYTFYPGRAARIIQEPDIRQHFANMDIEFQRITF